MNDRWESKKKYSRKDIVLVLNPPYDDRDEKFLSQIVVKLCWKIEHWL